MVWSGQFGVGMREMELEQAVAADFYMTTRWKQKSARCEMGTDGLEK